MGFFSNIQNPKNQHSGKLKIITNVTDQIFTAKFLATEKEIPGQNLKIHERNADNQDHAVLFPTEATSDIFATTACITREGENRYQPR
jgi:hypothetical protein